MALTKDEVQTLREALTRMGLIAPGEEPTLTALPVARAK